MKRIKVTAYAALLILTISSTALAGTIVGARTNRTGTIVGARSGNIAGARTGNIAGMRRGNSSRRDSTGGKLDLSSLVTENIDGILRLFLTRTLF